MWGYVLQHRLVAEWYIGRRLRRSECVHHEDGHKLNNSPENLWIFPNQAAHMRHHKKESLRYRADLAARLRPMAEDRRVSLSDAARRLGVSVATVLALSRVHQIPWLGANDSGLDEQSVREALLGRTTREAAAHLGVTHSTLRYRFDHLLAKRVSPGKLNAHKEEIRSLATSIRLDDIAHRYKVARETVRSSIERWRREEPDAWKDVSAFLKSRRGLGRPPRYKAARQLPRSP